MAKLKAGTSSEDVFNGGPDADHLVGTQSADRLNGRGGDDLLEGLGGNDRLEGGDGIDVLEGGAGNDVLLGGADTDYLYGGSGNDRIDGGAGSDDIYASSGNVTLSGGTGGDEYFINNANAVVNETGSGHDTVFYDIQSDETRDYSLTLNGKIETVVISNSGQGNLTVEGSSEGDSIDMNGTDTRVFGRGGNDVIFLSGEGNYANGGAGNDALWGASENDVLIGGDGNDLLRPGSGEDRVTGGAGKDTFYFSGGDSGANITDFQGNGDTLALDVSIFSGSSVLMPLLASQFRAGTGPGLVAQDADDHVLYDTRTGALYVDYDANGSEYEREFIATLHVTGTFNHNDILIT
jgi:Ca2+-binding RTX toxin-like protein